MVPFDFCSGPFWFSAVVGVCSQWNTLTLKFTFVLLPGTNPRLPRSGVGLRFRPSGQRQEYETSFTSQSVRLKPRAGTDRQPASDAVNTRLLKLSVRRYHLSRRSPVE